MTTARTLADTTQTAAPITSKPTKFKQAAVNLGNLTGGITIDLSAGDVLYGTLTGNISGITFTNPPAAGDATMILLELTQDATGSRTITWPASVYCDGGNRATNLAPVTTAGATTVYTLYTRDGGTTWKVTRGNSTAWANT